jgi:hypothetical protein
MMKKFDCKTQINTSYTINQDTSYFNLLRLARVSDKTLYTKSECAIATMILNQLGHYAAQHKRILPLLRAMANRLGIFKNLEQSVQQLLITATQNGVVTELAKQQQLSIIVKALSTANIPIILLKGAAFANVLYSHEAPRTSNDLDILIKKQDWHQAISAIKTVMDYSEKSQPDVLGDLYEISFIPKSKVGAALDLHSELIHPYLFNIDEQALWQSSLVHPTLNNEQVRILSPEHALIHQALHAFTDMDFAKYNLLDSHEIISELKPNVAKTITIAKEWGACTPLYVLLTNCKKIMDSEISKDILNQAQPCIFTLLSVKKCLASPFAQHLGGRKLVRYRLIQITSQFIFTGSLLRPLRFQWLFLTTYLKQKVQSSFRHVKYA